jgi:hypothetical protein
VTAIALEDAMQKMKPPEMKKKKPPRCKLDKLLARCNPKARRSKQEREWLDGKSVGRELI